MKNNLDFFYEKYDLTDKQKKQYNQYYELIKEYNKVMNLTGIDDEFGVYLKHYYDSLLISDLIKEEGLKIGDIGSGAGFPGIVLAIYFPKNNFDLIEPIKKRCNFLNEVVKELDLKNVNILNKRAEDLEKEKYDVITSRAVARLNILLELSIPLLKCDGLFIPLKGSKGQEELDEAKNALKELDSSVVNVFEETLPFEDSLRINIVIKKLKKSKEIYPRNFGQIRKKPL